MPVNVPDAVNPTNRLDCLLFLIEDAIERIGAEVVKILPSDREPA
jgi:hypothetical protein